LQDSQPVVPVVDYRLRKRDVAAFDPTAYARQIREATVVSNRSEAGYRATVLGDYDLAPFLHVIE
jgi:hypothetical protein